MLNLVLSTYFVIFYKSVLSLSLRQNLRVSGTLSVAPGYLHFHVLGCLWPRLGDSLGIKRRNSPSVGGISDLGLLFRSVCYYLLLQIHTFCCTEWERQGILSLLLTQKWDLQAGLNLFFSSFLQEWRSGWAHMFPSSSVGHCLASRPCGGIAFRDLSFTWRCLPWSSTLLLVSRLFLLPSVLKPRDKSCFSVLHRFLASVFPCAVLPLKILLLKWLSHANEKHRLF